MSGDPLSLPCISELRHIVIVPCQPLLYHSLGLIQRPGGLFDSHGKVFTSRLQRLQFDTGVVGLPTQPGQRIGSAIQHFLDPAPGDIEL